MRKMTKVTKSGINVRKDIFLKNYSIFIGIMQSLQYSEIHWYRKVLNQKMPIIMLRLPLLLLSFSCDVFTKGVTSILDIHLRV